MKTAAAPTYLPRKKPVQARSAATVETIEEATIQVLLKEGLQRLTTNRVARVAGVSVGTLYQYYPNKQSLLFALLDRHMSKVAHAVEQVNRLAQRKPLTDMVEQLVRTFLEAKLSRTDISTALYRISAEIGGPIIVARSNARVRKSMLQLLQTASDIQRTPDKSSIDVMFSAMSGVTRTALENGATPAEAGDLGKQLTLLCQSYMTAVAGHLGT